MLVKRMEDSQGVYQKSSFMSHEAFHAPDNSFRISFSHLPLKLFLKPQQKQERTAIIQDINNQHSETNQMSEWQMECWKQTVISNADLKLKKKKTHKAKWVRLALSVM